MSVRLSLVALSASLSSLFAQNIVVEAINGITYSGELRFGAINSENSASVNETTLALGGSVSLKTKPINGVSLVTTVFTTNAVFGQDENGMFLNSKNDGYAIVGEAYVKANINNTTIKAGRQIIDTPYADSDDIGMIPNCFEGYTLINQDIKDTTVILAWLDKFSGVDALIPEKFTDIQSSKEGVFGAGVIFDGIKDTSLSFWHYILENINFDYGEISYNKDIYNISLQYTDQDNSNRAYGVSLGVDILDELSVNTAYNKVDGVVTNGFGGGPFFTSSEDHTIADAKDQEAFLVSGEYRIENLTLGLVHVDFKEGENETDYIANFSFSENQTLSLIYSDMYDDGNMVRFFANYQF